MAAGGLGLGLGLGLLPLLAPSSRGSWRVRLTVRARVATPKHRHLAAAGELGLGLGLGLLPLLAPSSRGSWSSIRSKRGAACSRGVGYTYYGYSYYVAILWRGLLQDRGFYLLRLLTVTILWRRLLEGRGLYLLRFLKVTILWRRLL